MILTDKEIRELCLDKKNRKDRGGLIEPFSEDALQSESYDLAIGTEIEVLKKDVRCLSLLEQESIDISAVKMQLTSKIYNEIRDEVRDEALMDADNIIEKKAGQKRIKEFKNLMIDGAIVAFFVGMLVNQVSVVLAFYHKRDKLYRKLRHQINSSSQEKVLQYINYLIFEYTENVYFSKKIEAELKNNKMIEKVSQEANGLPTFGHLSVYNMFGMDYEAVKPEDIPNFLDENWAIKEEENTDGEE